MKVGSQIDMERAASRRNPLPSFRRRWFPTIQSFAELSMLEKAMLRRPVLGEFCWEDEEALSSVLEPRGRIESPGGCAAA